MRDAIYGAVIMGCLIASLFFVGFWRRSRDRFFVIFAIAFLLLGISWFVLILTGTKNEFNPPVYLTRLFAFLLIIVAVIYKNRPNTL